MQIAELCAMFFNHFRNPKRSQPASRDDFLLQLVTDMQQKGLQKMVGSLRAIAATKPKGYKRGRPGRRKK